MWTKFTQVAILALGIAIFFGSCSETADRPASKRGTSTVATPLKKTSGVVYKASPLAKEMRRMYANLEVAHAYLNSNETIPDSLLYGYDGILTAEATNPAEINDTYFGFARGWLSEMEVLRKDPNLENYNAVMSACVNCHQEFCPGPIPKIKKLRF
tara:strand:- start:35353 stop:35820 length:468 start_codon:yes stop_codon:yes gene_type:complete